MDKGNKALFSPNNIRGCISKTWCKILKGDHDLVFECISRSLDNVRAAVGHLGLMQTRSEQGPHLSCKRMAIIFHFLQTLSRKRTNSNILMNYWSFLLGTLTVHWALFVLHACK